MGLVNKIPRPSKQEYLPQFGPPPDEGEVFLKVRCIDNPKKKSKRQTEREELDEHMKNVEIAMQQRLEEQNKLLGELPF